jgi:hypothetical protein
MRMNPVWSETRQWKVLPLCALLLASGMAAPPAVAQTAGGSTYAVVITGLGGDADYEKLIEGWGKDLHGALDKSGIGKDRLFWLAARKQEGVYAEATGEQITHLLQTLATRLQPQDVFELFLIGHGSYDGYEYRFNIPGADLTAAQFAELLGRIRCERQLVVNMTSASGASVTPLQRKGRVVIASTTAGQERNFSVFARYFVAAVQDAASDADKNEEISALEAFRYATREVARYYEGQKRLATEHALIQDRGEGEGAREATPENGQGLLAGALGVRRLGAQQSAVDTPEVREARAQKRQIEESIERLKYNKASMDTEQYYEQLERLLVQLSQLQQRLDSLEKQAPR